MKGKIKNIFNITFLETAKWISFVGCLIIFLVSYILSKINVLGPRKMLVAIATILLYMSILCGFCIKKKIDKIEKEFRGEYSGVFTFEHVWLGVVSMGLIFIIPSATLTILHNLGNSNMTIIILVLLLQMLGFLLSIPFIPISYGVFTVYDNGIEVMSPFTHKLYPYTEVNKCYPKIRTHSAGGSGHRRVITYIEVRISMKDGKGFTVSHVIDNNAISNQYLYNETINNHYDSKMANYINEHVENEEISAAN